MRIFSVSLRRNILFLLFLLTTVYGSNSKNNPSKVKTHGKSKEPKLPSPSNNNNNNQQHALIEFQTKILIVCFSMFMLVFVLMLLIIGHFTWFAEIRRRLEEEWEQELKAEEERRLAKNILSEMRNPFVQNTSLPEISNVSSVIERRESVDSAGCTRGLCVPPHHSILCPNNPNIPSLTDPLFKHRDPDLYFHSGNNTNASITDPIDYRDQRSSTDWMNLESSVRVSEPVPVRSNIRGGFSSFMVPRRPVTPMTPDPLEPDQTITDLVDVELGRSREPTTTKTVANKSPPLSPTPKFDLSKLDMF